MPTEFSERLRLRFDSLSEAELLLSEQPSMDLFAEGSIVECKTIEELNSKAISALVAKNISGFANAEGGILILGVDSRRAASGEPESLSWKLVRDAAAMADQVRGSLHSLIEPPVPGIEIRSTVKEDGSGLVLIAVPRFDGHPVQARPEKEHGFWVRMGSSTTRMLYRQVAERFVAAPVPYLTLHWEWESHETLIERQLQDHRGQHGQVKLRLVARNDSAASIRQIVGRISMSSCPVDRAGEPYLPPVNWQYLRIALGEVSRHRGFVLDHSAGEQPISQLRERFLTAALGHSPLIYPGEEVCLLTWRIVTLPKQEGLHSLDLKVTLNADAMMPKQADLTLGFEELREQIARTHA